MKDLIISWNEDVGFYCGGISHQLLFVLLDNIVERLSLTVDRERVLCEIEYYFHLKEMNPDWNIELREEDGSDWIFG